MADVRVVNLRLESNELVPYRIKITAPHASWVEYGTDPHYVSQEGRQELRKWVKDKLGIKEDYEIDQVTNKIVWGIQKHGTKPHPYLFPAIEKVISDNEIYYDLEEVAERILYWADYYLEQNETNYTGELSRSMDKEPAPDIHVIYE